MQLSKYKPLYFKVKKIKKYAGRNNKGKITVRHQGGGHKQLYRTLDFNKNLNDGIVMSFEYDPNRSTFLAKILYSNIDNSIKSYGYINATKNLKIFDRIKNFSEIQKNFLLRSGDTSILTNFEVGDSISCVEAIPGKGATYARSAGTSCKILQQYSTKYFKLKMPSGEEKLVSTKSSAMLGVVSNEEHYKKILKKAGRSRWLNKRPTVRGVAMNPVDHPHGGGQGKTKGGRTSVTPNSRPTKGQPTRKKRKINKYIIKKNK